MAIDPQQIISLLFGGNNNFYPQMYKDEKIMGTPSLPNFPKEPGLNLLPARPTPTPSEWNGKLGKENNLGENSFNSNAGKGISPMSQMRNVTTNSQGVLGNEPLFNSKAAMDDYSYTPVSRNEGEGINDYVKRLIATPTGAGLLSEEAMKKMGAMNQANFTSFGQPQEPAASAGGGGGGTNTNTYKGVPGISEQFGINREIRDKMPNLTETKETDTFPYSNSINIKDMTWRKFLETLQEANNESDEERKRRLLQESLLQSFGGPY